MSGESVPEVSSRLRTPAWLGFGLGLRLGLGLGFAAYPRLEHAAHRH